jgi:hypothetical protein
MINTFDAVRPLRNSWYNLCRLQTRDYLDFSGRMTNCRCLEPPPRRELHDSSHPHSCKLHKQSRGRVEGLNRSVSLCQGLRQRHTALGKPGKGQSQSQIFCGEGGWRTWWMMSYWDPTAQCWMIQPYFDASSQHGPSRSFAEKAAGVTDSRAAYEKCGDGLAPTPAPGSGSFASSHLTFLGRPSVVTTTPPSKTPTVSHACWFDRLELTIMGPSMDMRRRVVVYDAVSRYTSVAWTRDRSWPARDIYQAAGAP